VRAMDITRTQKSDQPLHVPNNRTEASA
jgi:hypothetical protein